MLHSLQIIAAIMLFSLRVEMLFRHYPADNLEEVHAEPTSILLSQTISKHS